MKGVMLVKQGTLQHASSGTAKEWKATFNRRSPAFTTSWDEVPVAT